MVDLLEIFSEPPITNHSSVSSLWQSLGPFELQNLLDDEILNFEPALKVEKCQTYDGQYMYNIQKSDSQVFGMKGTQHGIGRQVFNYSVYEGQFSKNAPNGYGRKIFWTGNYEQGFFKDNVLHGEGVQVSADGKILKGMFKNG